MVAVQPGFARLQTSDRINGTRVVVVRAVVLVSRSRMKIYSVQSHGRAPETTKVENVNGEENGRRSMNESAALEGIVA